MGMLVHHGLTRFRSNDWITIGKITNRHLMSIAAFGLVCFTILMIRTMSITSCCDPPKLPMEIIRESKLDCRELQRRSAGNSQTMMHQIPLQPSTNSHEVSLNGSLESTLLFLYKSIDPPHWNDSDTGEQHLNMKIITNIHHRSLYIDKEDVTLVTHGSIEKFSQLVDQVHRWQGPVSFVMYLTTESEIHTFCSSMIDKASSDVLKFVSIHVLLEKHGGSLPYPNNILRNIAQRNIESSYFLLMDVDFIPSPGMYSYLKKNLENDYFWTRLRNNTVFVLPAFELFAAPNEEFASANSVPTSKEELRLKLRQQEAATFHHYFPPGHYPTNFSLWLQPNVKHEFSYPIEYQKRFEPYVVAYKRGISDFWDGFRGFGFNAASWFWELHLAGYRYEVMHDYFVTHLNHPGRKGRNITAGSIAKLQLRRFMRYISRKYQVDQVALRYWKGKKYGNGTHVSLVCYTCK
jgi:Glycosyl-transferase for dystroglycan